MATSVNPSATAEIVARANELFEDLSFASARKWKAAAPGRKAIGYMPIYVPREIIHAAGMLPVGILGGGDQLEVIHGDAYYQSYICRIPRSTIELGVSGRLDFLDGMLFPSICDVIRNLSGMWKMMFPTSLRPLLRRAAELPGRSIGGNFYIKEIGRARHDLARARAASRSRDDELRHSIAVYNENRKLVRELYAFRARTAVAGARRRGLSVLRAGMRAAGRGAHDLLREYLAAARADERPERDNAASC